MDEIRQRLAERDFAEPPVEWHHATGTRFGGAEFLLVAACFVIAVWNTAVGPSGIVSFAAMAAVLPPAAVVPVHAAVWTAWTAANLSRCWLLRRSVDRTFLYPFMLGGIAGFIAGFPLLTLVTIPENILRIVLGGFILFATWAPFTGLVRLGGSFAGAGGVLTSFLTLFVGATTSLVAAMVAQRHENHHRVIGTTAACMLFQHGVKTIIFASVGFGFAGYFALLILLIAATSSGAWVGKQMLFRVPQTIVRPVFKAVLTILALNLIRDGVTA